MKKNWVLLSVLCSLFTAHGSPSVCPLEFGPFNDAMCQDKDFFELEGPNEIKKINEEILAIPLQEVYHDNSADPKFAVEKISADLRVYADCFYKLCDQIADDCSKARSTVANSNIPDQTEWCEARRDKFIELQQAKIKYLLSHNTARKHRSLYEEKIARMGFRFEEFLHPSIKNQLRLLQKIGARISELLPLPKE